jgi:Family of unknown function (DUF6111)
MIRVGLTEIVLFLTPFALYGVYLYATRSGVIEVKSWPVTRLVWLAIAAFVLVIGSFVIFAQFSGAPIGATYTPAHLDENGKFVPGMWK